MASVPEDEVTATEHQVDVETAGNGDQQDLEGQLKDLIAQATSKYAIKDYNTAAELYSQATELQAELRGEMAIENADLLYAYGKCLYFVAVSKSDVLGTKAAGDKMSNPKEEKKTKGKRKSALEASSTSAPARENQDQRVAEEIVAAIVTEKDAEGKVDLPSDAKAQKTGDKPFFQFTGDENWDDSDDEEEADEEDGEEEEEEDEFSNAFEILDIARVLLNKRLEQLQDTALAQAGKGKSKELVGTDTPELRLAKERLADTHDLQAEISLEGERFPNAVVDLRAALELKQGLYPQESSQIAECHYKLSLALEFASVTQQKEENEEAAETKPAVVDEAMRKEAAEEMEKAIESCEARIKKEQAELNSRLSGSESTDNGETRRKPITQKDIDEVKELVADMRQRLTDLRAPPVSMSDPNSTGALDGSIPLQGILGQIYGESTDQQKERLAEATRQATDLSGSGMIRKKAKPTTTATATSATAVAPAPVNGSTTNGKRRLDADGVLADNNTSSTSSKRTKVEVEDTPES